MGAPVPRLDRNSVRGHLKPLIIPSFFGDAFSIFLLRQFFMTIPKELTDAMRVDGAGEFQILMRVVVPLAKPAIAAVGAVQLHLRLERLLRAAGVRGGNTDSQTLSIALSSFRGIHHVNWNLTMAAALLFMLPIVIIFFLPSGCSSRAITLTGVKG